MELRTLARGTPPRLNGLRRHRYTFHTRTRPGKPIPSSRKCCFPKRDNLDRPFTDLNRESTMNEQALLNRITVNPQIFGGKPIVRGRRNWPWSMCLGCSPLAIRRRSFSKAIPGWSWRMFGRAWCMCRHVGHERIEPLQSSRCHESVARHMRVGQGRGPIACSRPRRGLGRRLGRGSGDEEILKRARRRSRILITLDKDFGEMVIVHGQAHSGIVRIVELLGPSARERHRARARPLRK